MSYMQEPRRIVVITGDERLGSRIGAILKGWQVQAVPQPSSPAKGLSNEGEGPAQAWDAALVDAASVPPEEVSRLCRDVRVVRKDGNVPVLVLVSDPRNAPDYACGYDDFVAGDFYRGDPSADLRLRDELIARIELAIWKRSDVAGGDLIKVGEMIIDSAAYRVTVSGELLELTYKEYELLLIMATNPGRAFTRQTLLETVWGYDYFGGTRTVDVHIRRLRQKLGDDHALLIETVRNVGYRFSKP